MIAALILALLILAGCQSEPNAAAPTPFGLIISDETSHDYPIVEYTDPGILTCTCLAIAAPTVPLALASFVEQWVMPMRCELLSLNCETLYALTVDVAGERVFSLEMGPQAAAEGK